MHESRTEVRKLVAEEATALGRTAIRRLFQSTDTFHPPILSHLMAARAIGFPFWQHDLTRAQWLGFREALRELRYHEEFGYVIATTLPRSDDFWQVGIDVDYPYPELVQQGWPSVWESVLLSPQGQWALVVLDEEFGIAAGDPTFVRAVTKHMPEFRAEGIAEFVDYWRDGLARAPREARAWAWLPAILEDVLGSEEGRRLARECGARA
jgi:hypothetical protein